MAKQGKGELPSAEWEARVAALWEAIEGYDGESFVAQMDVLTSELGEDHPVGLFERGSAFDSTGNSDKAVPLYRRALELGLDGSRRRRAVIQMASSLRNMGQAEESVALLTAEREAKSDELDDAVSAFLALALADLWREREAASVALAALGPHLPRYERSVVNYAGLLLTSKPR